LLTANSREIPQRNGHNIGHRGHKIGHRALRVPRLWCQSAAGTPAGLSHRLLAGYAGVSINSATPVAGWKKSWKIPSIFMATW